MAPVEVENNPSYIPLLLAVSRIAAAAYASSTVGQSLYQSNKALSPAQDTRNRTVKRNKLTVAFGGLAVVGLVLAVTSSVEYLTLSYRVWASERGIEVANRGLFGDGLKEAALYLRHWLSDTPVFFDALEIVAEKTRRLWWGQQVDLATIAWTALLVIEGRRRRIPHLWAYALLPHLVSLSFAQNLLYVALLQTPAPIPSPETRLARVFHFMFPEKPRKWFPRLPLLLIPLALNYLVTLWLPGTAGTPSFPTAVLLSKFLTFAPLVLPAIAPTSWGTVHPDPREAYPDITKLFNFIAAANALLHAKTTLSALLYNLPDSHKHRHSIKIPFDTERRTKWERTATAAEKVLGSMADHPAVAAAGKDALMCALSLGLWVAVRSVDVGNMLHALYDPNATWSRRPRLPSLPVKDRAAGGKRAKAKLTHAGKREQEDAEEKTAPSPPANGGVPPLSMTLRRRGGRHSKKTSASSVNSAVDGPVENTTTAAANHDHDQAPKRRGRPRKVKSEHEPESKPKLEPELDRDDDNNDDDDTYRPTPAVRADVRLGDPVPPDDFDWEPAALAWGLTAVGGLGLASAAVFGAECLAR
ncbi:hypothetical protein C7999DRAFT_36876 [Corynascus novoguineensis]|uniref:Uncharacterized protein n=1 Tax=Corynascus novoguineensis TaxID=1126955 RepID=A0AAN7D278_9PEZI|nr:hypothetical protein C7999DRAFT_36876 [Corynascus novoguineensis]